MEISLNKKGNKHQYNRTPVPPTSAGVEAFPEWTDGLVAELSQRRAERNWVCSEAECRKDGFHIPVMIRVEDDQSFGMRFSSCIK